MLTEERHSIITDTVNTRKSVTIAELCRILDVSASTVKRDLNILAEAGKITKVRGGAISLDESFSAVEKNVEEKSAICTEEKTAIAAYAASLVENGDFIYLLTLSAGDRKLMTERLNISAEQLAYVTNADPGSGLLFFQNVILPFKDEFPKTTELYRLLTTKPSEVSHDGETG